MKGHCILSHGFESGPDATKVTALADAAERLAHASLRGLRGAHLRERLASGEAAGDIAHALGLAALPNVATRAREADLASSILEAARRLAAPLP